MFSLISRAIDAYTHPLTILVTVLILKLLTRVFVDRLNGNIAIKIAEMERESAAIKRKAASLAVPSTFAQSAKIERQAIALDKEIERLRAASKNISPLLNLTQKTIKSTSAWHSRLIWIYGLFIFGFRQPIIYLPSEITGPVSVFLRTFSKKTAAGAISLGMWLQLCDLAANELWKRTIPDK